MAIAESEIYDVLSNSNINENENGTISILISTPHTGKCLTDPSVIITKSKIKYRRNTEDTQQIKIGDSVSFNKHNLKGSVKLSGKVVECLDGGRMIVEADGERCFILLSDIIWSYKNLK